MHEDDEDGDVIDVNLLFAFESVLCMHTEKMEYALDTARRERSPQALQQAAAVGCRALRDVLSNPSFDRALIAFHRRGQTSTRSQRRARTVANEFLTGHFERFLQVERDLLMLYVPLSDERVEGILQQCREASQSGIDTRASVGSAENFVERVRAVVRYLRNQVCGIRDSLQVRNQAGASGTDYYSSDDEIVMTNVLRAMGGLIVIGVNFAVDAIVLGLSPIATSLSGSVGYDLFIKGSATAVGLSPQTVRNWIREGPIAVEVDPTAAMIVGGEPDPGGGNDATDLGASREETVSSWDEGAQAAAFFGSQLNSPSS